MRQRIYADKTLCFGGKDANGNDGEDEVTFRVVCDYRREEATYWEPQDTSYDVVEIQIPDEYEHHRDAIEEWVDDNLDNLDWED